MFDDPSEIPLQIDFLLIKDFSMMAFTSAIEPLRLANRVAGKELYQWRIISLDGNSVKASNGAEILVAQSATTIENVKIIFVVSGVNVQMYEIVAALARNGLSHGLSHSCHIVVT